jgi:[ribosomal protein S18]-alanine N-acetyltransferase
LDQGEIALVRAAGEADLDAVMEIERLCFSTPWERQAFADELARPWASLWLLCEVPSGRAVGFCNHWLVAGEMQILNVAVHPDHRRRGHAARLLRHILAEAQEKHVTVVSLEVRASNHAAQALYRRFGFRDVGRRPRYYADNGEDALLMDFEVARTP